MKNKLFIILAALAALTMAGCVRRSSARALPATATRRAATVRTYLSPAEVTAERPGPSLNPNSRPQLSIKNM